MLANDRIHADLSAYNVLYWAEQAKIIDLPQAVDPYVNPEGLALLTRDLERLCDHFARYGIEADAVHLARDLWDSRILHRASRDTAP
jgi:RIO kinase 1